MKPSLARVYDMLEAAGSRGVTSGEFARAFVLRFSARIHELRKLGLEVHAEKLPGRSQWLFVLRKGLVPRWRVAAALDR
mgnify:CR=1 FL=1